ncbi:hypothetical protein ABK040_004371 [Willaertia magna]
MDDEALLNFMSITGENDVDSAKHYLEAAGFDNTNTSAFDFDNERSPIPQHASRLYDNFNSPTSGFTYDYPPYIQNQFNPQQNQQYQTTSKFNKGSEEFNELFKKPEDVVFKGTFDAAKRFAEENSRWLLVDVLKDDIFQCHQLNRDTWANDVVKTLINNFFVFWQVDESTSQGQFFKSRYPIYQYPYICIIDPRTGENVKSWSGKFVDAPTMVDYLQNFIDSHSLMDHLPSPSPNTLHAPNPFENVQIKHQTQQQKQPHPPTIPPPQYNSSTSVPVTHHNVSNEEDEEEMIRRAIQASLEEATSNNVMEDDDVIEVPPPQEEEKPKQTPDMSIDLSKYIVEQGDTTRIQIKLPDGKRDVVKILKSAPLAAIYALAREKLQGSGIDKFIVTYFDKSNKQNTLENILEKTLADEGLVGASLSVVQE